MMQLALQLKQRCPRCRGGHPLNECRSPEKLDTSPVDSPAFPPYAHLEREIKELLAKLARRRGRPKKKS